MCILQINLYVLMAPFIGGYPSTVHGILVHIYILTNIYICITQWLVAAESAVSIRKHIKKTHSSKL